MAWTPDGQLLATGSGDGVVHLWDVARGKETARLRGTGIQELKVRSVEFHPEDGKLAAAYDDGIVRVWDLKKRTNEPIQLRGWMVAWSLDGGFLATACAVAPSTGLGRYREVRARLSPRSGLGFGLERRGPPGFRLLERHDLDLEPPRRLARSPPPEGHELGVNSCCLERDGTLLASASSDDTVRVWNDEAGEQVWCFDGHQDSVLAEVWSADGETLVSGSKDQTVRIWRLDRRQNFDEAPLLGHKGAGCWSPAPRIGALPSGTWKAWKATDSVCQC